MDRPRRKRKTSERGSEVDIDGLLNLVAGSSKVLAFTGSGLSASTGMSMFSTKNGLYERARKRFKIQDGMKLFTYSFYKQRKQDVQAFFAQIYSEAQDSKPARGHEALGQLHELKKLQRHYTMNIDGLAEDVGMDTWHWEFNPEGITVEMHGCIRDTVCPSCNAVQPLNRTIINVMKAKKPVQCENCKSGEMRFKVMLYDDQEGDCITPEDVWERLNEDLEVCDLLLWVGISFEQSASVEYFKRVRQQLCSIGRLKQVKQVVINPSEDAMWNLMTACSNTADLDMVEVRMTSDEALPALVEQLKSSGATGAACTAGAARAAGAARTAACKADADAAQAGKAAGAAAAGVSAPRSGTALRQGLDAAATPAAGRGAGSGAAADPAAPGPQAKRASALLTASGPKSEPKQEKLDRPGPSHYSMDAAAAGNSWQGSHAYVPSYGSSQHPASLQQLAQQGAAGTASLHQYQQMVLAASLFKAGYSGMPQQHSGYGMHGMLHPSMVQQGERLAAASNGAGMMGWGLPHGAAAIAQARQQQIQHQQYQQHQQHCHKARAPSDDPALDVLRRQVLAPQQGGQREQQ